MAASGAAIQPTALKNKGKDDAVSSAQYSEPERKPLGAPSEWSA
jgi:hypothetical protein